MAAIGATIPGSALVIGKTNGTVVLDAALNLGRTGQDLTFTNGALDLAGYSLTVNDRADIDGTLRLKGNETISIGTLDLNTNTSTVVYYESGTNAYVTNLPARVFRNLTFGAAKNHYFGTGTVNEITVFGTMASDAARDSRSVLRSISDGTQWYLNLQGSSSLENRVDVKDSNASAGKPVEARGSVDSGNNINWCLCSGTVVWLK